MSDIPDFTYTLYLYSSGVGGNLRTVFLKRPDSAVEIVPYSAGIEKAAGTFEDAMAFMQKGAGYVGSGFPGRVDVRSVLYRGAALGYVLTYYPNYGLFIRESIDVSLYERDGKIYLSIWDRMYEP